MLALTTTEAAALTGLDERTVRKDVEQTYADPLEGVITGAIDRMGERPLLTALHRGLTAHAGWGSRFEFAAKSGDVELASRVMLDAIAADGHLGPYWP